LWKGSEKALLKGGGGRGRVTEGTVSKWLHIADHWGGFCGEKKKPDRVAGKVRKKFEGTCRKPSNPRGSVVLQIKKSADNSTKVAREKGVVDREKRRWGLRK